MDLDYELDAQPMPLRTMRGTIWLFLKANQFRVQLSDGQLVNAVLADALIDQMLKYYESEPLVDRIGVTVELREAPAMHCIIEIHGDDGWCGVARGAWR